MWYVYISTPLRKFWKVQEWWKTAAKSSPLGYFTRPISLPHLPPGTSSEHSFNEFLQVWACVRHRGLGPYPQAARLHGIGKGPEVERPLRMGSHRVIVGMRKWGLKRQNTQNSG